MNNWLEVAHRTDGGNSRTQLRSEQEPGLSQEGVPPAFTVLPWNPHRIIFRGVKADESVSPALLTAPRLPSRWLAGNPTGSMIPAVKDIPQV